MGRRAGSPKTGGRRKGTPNKKSQELSEILSEGGLNVPERLLKLLPKLTEDKQASVLMALMGFLYPKKKAVEFTAQNEGGPRVVVTLPSNGREDWGASS